MTIEFDSKAEATRWLRLTAAPLGRSGHFWTELRDGRLHSGAATADVRVDVSLPCDGARPLARRWHARTLHPSSRPSLTFEPAHGALAPPDDQPPHALSTPFGAAPTELPESIARHPVVQRVQRSLPGVVPEVRYHPGRFTVLWSSPALRVRLQLHTAITAHTCDLPTAPATPAPRLRHATDALAGILGGRGHVVLTGRACADIQPATYRLVEASRLIPSHDAHTFRPRPDYPTGVQERRYHADKAEQQKVLDNSAPGCFQPAIIANTDPTALGGTPIATPDGVVLGGNSRTMVLQRIYAATPPTAATAYRKHLTAHLHEFDLPPAALAGMTAPVVVRVVEPPTADKPHLRDLVRRYNEGLTQDLERTAEQVAVSARLNDAILAELQRVEDDTLTAFLTSPASKGLVRLLVQAELIPKARQNRLIASTTGLLSDEGRAFLQRALLGRILPHPDLLDLLTDSLKDSLARATPYILNAATVHNDPATRARWDVTHRLPDAVRVWSRARAASLKDASELAHQRELTTDGLDPLDAPNVLLANILLLRAGPRQLPDVFRTFAEASAYTNTPSLFGDHTLPVTALAKAAKLPVPTGTGIADAHDFSPRHDAPKLAPKPEPRPTPTPAPKPAPKPPTAPKPAPRPPTAPAPKAHTPASILAALHKAAPTTRAEALRLAGQLGADLEPSRQAVDAYLATLPPPPTPSWEVSQKSGKPTLPVQRPRLPAYPITLVGEDAAGELHTADVQTADRATLERLGIVKVYGLWPEDAKPHVRPRLIEQLKPMGERQPSGDWTWRPFDPWLGHAPPDTKGGWWAYSLTGLAEDAVKVAADKADYYKSEPQDLGTLWWVPLTILKGGIRAFRRSHGTGLIPVKRGRALTPSAGGADRPAPGWSER